MEVRYLLLVFCLILTACGSAKAVDSHNAADSFKPTLDVKLDVSGNQVKVKVQTDMKIAPDQIGKTRKSGEGHIHMYLDNGEKINVTTEETVFKDLAPGNHTFKVSLHNNDHTPYDVTKTLDFAIK